MAKPFRQALREALDSTGIPLKRIAEESGVSYDQLKKFMSRARESEEGGGKAKGSTNVDDAVKVANAFGMTLDEFIGDQTALLRSEVVELYRQLSADERQILRDAARGRSAQGQAAG